MSSTPKRTPVVERKPKTIYQLGSPFTTVTWPETSAQIQENILELLCSTLSPIGQHRANHIWPSKGKRSKKRRRDEAKEKDAAQESPIAVPCPEISSFVVVGLNSITRSLEALSQKSKPTAIATSQERPQSDLIQVAGSDNPDLKVSNGQENLDTSKEAKEEPELLSQHFAAIFVPRSSQPPILHAHLPQLIATASLAQRSLPATRLVQLPKGCDSRLCDALGLPRVSFIGILEGAPHSKALMELVRESVPEIDVPWLREVGEKQYLSVKINAVQTTAPVVEKEMRE